MLIEVYADIVCPFTHVGLRRFVARRAELGRDDLVLRVHAWPLEVVNGEPLDPHHVAVEIEALRDQLAPDAFRGFDEERFPATSLPALAVAAAAYRHGDRVGEAVSLELRDLLFEQGADITDPAVLDAVARRHGLEVTDADRAAPAADRAEGAARGVVGSPHFFVANADFFCPGLDISRDDEGNFHIAPKPAVFDRFLEACLAT